MTLLIRDAYISDCGLYRYALDRVWDESKPRVCFAMLNPSTADAEKDDPTIRRCIAFAQRWGYGGLVVVNLFAYRATDPNDLWAARTGPLGMLGVIGAHNVRAWEVARKTCQTFVAAWGAGAAWYYESYFDSYGETPLFGDVAFWCLGVTKDGYPRHPLYCPSSASLALFFGHGRLRSDYEKETDAHEAGQLSTTL